MPQSVETFLGRQYLGHSWRLVKRSGQPDRVEYAFTHVSSVLFAAKISNSKRDQAPLVD